MEYINSQLSFTCYLLILVSLVSSAVFCFFGASKMIDPEPADKVHRQSKLLILSSLL
jgi:hypothetical protein